MKMSWFSKNCRERSALQQNIDGGCGKKQDKEEDN